MLKGAKAGEWDIAFVALNPERAPDWDFTAAYFEVDNTYLVPAGSPIRNIADADRPGNRIAVSNRSTQDAFLSARLKQAELIRVPVVAIEGLPLLTSGKVHAMAGNYHVLVELAKKTPGTRVVEGTLYGTPQAIAVAKGRPAGAAYAIAFVEHAKASGLVEKAVKRAKLDGVTLLPAAGTKANP